MIILPANTLSGGYEVANSCRFAEGDSAHLSRTFGSAGNRRTFTVSFWYKTTTKITTGQSVKFGAIFDAGADGSNSDDMYFHTDRLNFSGYYGSTQFMLRTTAKYRDPSAWTHFVVAFDTTQGVAANRIKMYANGTQITAFDEETYPAENFQTSYMNLDRLHNIGTLVNSDGFPLDGYLAEFCFIDGLALAPTSFGEFNEDSPTIWQPIDVSGLTFGTNGCYLDFEDSSNLGNDANGGTDYASTNLAATDQATDTPTNNFATLNSLENFYPAATISEGNLKAVTVTAKYTFLRSSIGVSSGKWYMETKCTAQSGSTNKWTFGITDHGSTGTQNFIGQNSYSYGWRGDANSIFYNGTLATYGSGAMATGDIIGMALDLDNNKIYWSINGTFKNSGDPASNSNGFSITAPASTNTGYYHFAFGDIDGDQNFTYETNFGNAPFTISSGNSDGNGYGNFEYAVPSGYYALNTKNLAEFG